MCLSLGCQKIRSSHSQREERHMDHTSHRQDVTAIRSNSREEVTATDLWLLIEDLDRAREMLSDVDKCE